MFRDGPLTRRLPEVIRYGTGGCALGALLVALSDLGIVSIMVRDTQARLIRDLTARFPKAKLVRDEKGCKTLVAKVARYIAAPFRPFPLPLDIRGTELQQRVWNEVRKIPFGETSTYSKIARAIGDPKAIRAVASSCARSWFAFAIPCHRVLHTGATPGRGREGRQYEWVDYEAELAAKRRAGSPRLPSSPQAWNDGCRGKGMRKPQVLAACPPSAMPTLERVLGAHVDFTFTTSLNAASAVVRTNPDLAMIVCGVHFDESRMYDLLEYSRRERPDVPFLCVRVLDGEVPRISRQGIAMAAQSAGAAAFIDFADLVIERGVTAAEQGLETAVLTRLHARARKDN